MKIIKLKEIKKKRVVKTYVTKFMRVDGVKIPLSYDAEEVFDALRESDGEFHKVALYNEDFILAMRKAGLIVCANRGNSSYKSGDKFTGTKKFLKNYEKLDDAVFELIYGEKRRKD